MVATLMQFSLYCHVLHPEQRGQEHANTTADDEQTAAGRQAATSHPRSTCRVGPRGSGGCVAGGASPGAGLGRQQGMPDHRATRRGQRKVGLAL